MIKKARPQIAEKASREAQKFSGGEKNNKLANKMLLSPNPGTRIAGTFFYLFKRLPTYFNSSLAQAGQ
jgi:hypothetical protein